jgi:hypothetical protein
MSEKLLAVVGVEKADRVVCQAQGCGHGVYRRIHIVRHDNGVVGVYGSDCFSRLFGHLVECSPRYGSGDGRELTADERQMLSENTERLIAQFEAEQQALLEQARLHQEQQAKVEQAARERLERQREDAERRRTQTARDLAAAELEAKAIVRQKYSVDPDAPGWRGLVLDEVRKLLAR